MRPNCFLKLPDEMLLKVYVQELNSKGINHSLDDSLTHDYAVCFVNSQAEVNFYNNISSKTIFISSNHLEIPVGAKLVLLQKDNTNSLNEIQFANVVINTLLGFFDTSVLKINYSPLINANTNISKKSKFSKKLLLLPLAISLPFFAYGLSIIFLILGLNLFNYNSNLSKRSLVLSEKTATIFGTLAGANLIADTARVNRKFIEVSEQLGNFKNSDMGYNLKHLSINLNSLYKDISFLDTKIKNNKFISNVLGDSVSSNTRELVSIAQLVTEALPQLVGDEWDEEYLIIFQEDGGLTPTGGIISAASKFTVREGIVESIKTYNADQIDSKIGGLVEVPFDIQDGSEKQWSFADINWTPDFSKTAEYARWFIDKSLDQDVEHVLLVKQSARKVFEDYFKVSNYSDLSKKMSENIFDPNFASILKSNLDKGEILIYSTDPKVEQLVASQSWGGEPLGRDCHDINCLELSTGFYNFQTSGGESELEFNLKPTVTLNLDTINLSYILKVKNNDNSPYEGYITFLWNNLDKIDSQTQLISLRPDQEKILKFEINYPYLVYVNRLLISFSYPKEASKANLDFEFFNKKGGAINTKPLLNLTKEGSLRYTTILQDSKVLEIKLNSNE